MSGSVGLDMNELDDVGALELGDHGAVVHEREEERHDDEGAR
jgi:hypothetical protein